MSQSDTQAGEWTQVLNYKWVGAETSQKAVVRVQKRVEQGVGEQHLQSTVNMRNEQLWFL